MFKPHSNPVYPDCTAGGSPCQLPYLHQGRLTFSCTTEAPSTAGGGQDLFGRCPVTLADQVRRHRSSFLVKIVCTAVRLWCVPYITYVIFNTSAVTFS